MTRFNHYPSPEYREAKELVEEAINLVEDSDDPKEDYGMLVSDVLSERIKEDFVENNDLVEAESPCVAKLTAGWDECKHHDLNMGEDERSPPHSPPHADHSTLYLDEETGEPVVYSMHLYDVDRDVVNDILDFGDRNGLKLYISSSWYYLTKAVHVFLYSPEWSMSQSQSDV